MDDYFSIFLAAAMILLVALASAVLPPQVINILWILVVVALVFGAITNIGGGPD